MGKVHFLSRMGFSHEKANGGRIRESDVAHEVSNTFQLLHVHFTNADAVTKFVQLHGFD